jgi:hypothetical protein
MMPQASGPLDGPPPSPQMFGGGPTGGATPFSLSAMAPPQVPSAQMPPEILTGILQSASTIGELLDSYAQVAPDLAMEFAAIKEQLQVTLASLVQAGAGATSPTATGPAFPGGGMDRGIAGAGAV